MVRLLLVGMSVALSVGCSSFKGEALSSKKAPPLVDGRAGKVVVIAFGYTSCPDVCPTALSRMKGLYRALGPDAARVSMAFVTVDPERDPADRLDAYVAAFDERIVPVRRSGAELRELLTSYGAVSKIRAERRNVPYAVDHTSGFLVVDPAGNLRLRLPPELSEADMLADIRKLIADAPAVTPVEIQKPFARLTTNGVGALYLDVVNPGTEPDRLLRVETAAAKHAELHETVQTGDVAQMIARPEGFVVPAGAKLALGPGGKHVMLFGVAEPGASSVGATLVFERAGRVAARFSTAVEP